jgi:hypothetical protein
VAEFQDFAPRAKTPLIDEHHIPRAGEKMAPANSPMVPTGHPPRQIRFARAAGQVKRRRCAGPLEPLEPGKADADQSAPRLGAVLRDIKRSELEIDRPFRRNHRSWLEDDVAGLARRLIAPAHRRENDQNRKPHETRYDPAALQ